MSEQRVKARIRVEPRHERNHVVLVVDRETLDLLLEHGEVERLDGDIDTGATDSPPLGFGSIELIVSG